MGFGLGIEADARRGAAVANVAGSAWALSPLRLAPPWESAPTTRLLFITPANTVPFRDLVGVDAGGDSARYAHALELVTRSSEASRQGAIVTLRSVLGDARDLLMYGLRRHLAWTQLVTWVGNEHGPGVRVSTDIGLSSGGPLPFDQSWDGGVGVIFVHIGPTEKSREILGALRDSAGAWDGIPESLDADGYVHVCARQGGGAVHVLIIGGSDYGTYFGVSAFLQQYAHAAWLFPGPLGEEIRPASPPILEMASLNWLDEPTLRSRSYAGMSQGRPAAALNSVVECDEIRTWQLRNRLRPTFDRSQIFVSARAAGDEPGLPNGETRLLARNLGCALDDERDRPFVIAMLETEDRIPVHHNLERHLSPFLAPFGSARLSLERVFENPSIYPDVRPRQVPDATADGSINRFTFGLDQSIDPRLGSLPEPHLTYALDGFSACPGQPEFQAFTAERGLSADPNAPRHLIVNEVTTYDRDRMKGVVKGQFCEFLSITATSQLRFVPRTSVHRHEADQEPFGDWHPCIFETDPSLRVGTMSRSRADLARDLAAQTFMSMLGRVQRYGEPNYSLAFNDGSVWCHCDACDRMDAFGGAGGDLLHYLGAWIGSRTVDLEMSEGTVTDPRLGLTGASMLRSRSLTATFLWNPDPTLNPFAYLTLDELATRGVLHHGGYPQLMTRRVLVLLNQVANQLDTVVTERVPTPLQGILNLDRRVIAFLAYSDYSAPPMRGPFGDSVDLLAQSLGERCHPTLMPFLTGTRDTQEYTNSLLALTLEVTPGSTAGALRRARNFPDQFNHERWSAISRVTGFYEYNLGTMCVVPRVYSARIRNALSRGAQRRGGNASRSQRVRGFTSEVYPSWGLQAPMLWELTQVLWDPEGDPASLRERFCSAAFRSPSVSSLMHQYFDVCEQATAATRDHTWTRFGDASDVPSEQRPDVRNTTMSLSAYFGQGPAGRLGFLSQFDGWYEEDSSAGTSRLLHAWNILNQAYREAASDRIGQARVNLFRRTFGLTLLIGLWYEPLARAFNQIRATNFGSSEFVNVRTLGDMVAFHQVADTSGAVVTMSGMPGQIRDNITPTRTVLMPAMLAPTLVGPVRRCMLGADGTTPGIRTLRHQVHRYIAKFGDFTSNELPALGSGLPVDSWHDIGLGFFPDEPTLGIDAPFPSGTPVGDCRHVGFNLSALRLYIGWWRAQRLTTHDELVDSGVLDTRLQGGENTESFGWIFEQIKQMAATVLLYSANVVDEAMATPNLMRYVRAILRG